MEKSQNPRSGLFMGTWTWPNKGLVELEFFFSGHSNSPEKNGPTENSGTVGEFDHSLLRRHLLCPFLLKDFFVSFSMFFSLPATEQTPVFFGNTAGHILR